MLLLLLFDFVCKNNLLLLLVGDIIFCICYLYYFGYFGYLIYILDYVYFYDCLRYFNFGIYGLVILFKSNFILFLYGFIFLELLFSICILSLSFYFYYKIYENDAYVINLFYLNYFCYFLSIFYLLPISYLLDPNLPDRYILYFYIYLSFYFYFYYYFYLSSYYFGS